MRQCRKGDKINLLSVLFKESKRLLLLKYFRHKLKVVLLVRGRNDWHISTQRGHTPFISKSVNVANSTVKRDELYY